MATATVVVTTSKGTRFEMARPLGRIPIMVRAAKCWLHGLGPKETIRHKEVCIDTQQLCVFSLTMNCVELFCLFYVSSPFLVDVIPALVFCLAFDGSLR